MAADLHTANHGRDAACAPRRGRPRSVEADEAILVAAAALFAEHGYEGLRVEDVAEAAGVAKTTVYRRYPSKAELLLAAVEHLAGTEAAAPDTGTIEGDLLEAARNVRRVLTHSDLGRTIPAALAAAAAHPELADAHRALVARRRGAILEVVRRAVAGGELPAGTDPALLVDQVVAPIFYRTFVSGGRVDDRTLRALVASAVAGARAAGG